MPEEDLTPDEIFVSRVVAIASLLLYERNAPLDVTEAALEKMNLEGVMITITPLPTGGFRAEMHRHMAAIMAPPRGSA